MLNRAVHKLCKYCYLVKDREEFPDAMEQVRKGGTKVMNKHSVCKECAPHLSAKEKRSKNL